MLIVARLSYLPGSYKLCLATNYTHEKNMNWTHVDMSWLEQSGKLDLSELKVDKWKNLKFNQSSDSYDVIQIVVWFIHHW